MTSNAAQQADARATIFWLEQIRTELHRADLPIQHDSGEPAALATGSDWDRIDLQALEEKVTRTSELSLVDTGRRTRIQQLEQYIRTRLHSHPAHQSSQIPANGLTQLDPAALTQANALVDAGVDAEHDFLALLQQQDQDQKLLLRAAFLPLLALLGAFCIFMLFKVRNDFRVRQNTAHLLEDSERRYRQIVETAAEGIWITDAQGQITFSNQQLAAMLGYRRSELLAASFFNFIDRNTVAEAHDLLAEWQRGVNTTCDLCLRRKDGEELWVTLGSRALFDDDGQFEGTLGMLSNITPSKRAALVLSEANETLERRVMQRTSELEASNAQLRELRAHQENIREDERQRIARDVHDDLGQNLMVLKIDVDLLHAQIASSNAHLSHLSTKTAQMIETIDTTIASVRAIINDLHPSVLALGLCPAVEWLLDNFSRRTMIAGKLVLLCDCEKFGLDKIYISAAFRIVQEALVNVLRHARASEVQITLDLDAEYLTIVVADNGIGMQSGDHNKAGAFGLKGMQERVDAFGGSLHIDDADGRGVTLSIRIALLPEKHAIKFLALHEE